MALWSSPTLQRWHPYIGPGVHDSVLMIVPPTPTKLFHISFGVMQGTWYASFDYMSYKIGADESIRIESEGDTDAADDDELVEIAEQSDESGEGFYNTYGPGEIPFMGRTSDAGFFVPHISIPPNNSMLPLTIIFGSSLSLFGASAVKLKTNNPIFGHDEQGMACCIPPAPITFNVSCQDPIPMPLDIGISWSTVEVGVSMADVWAALIDYALEVALELVMAGIGDAIGKGFKKAKMARKGAQAGAEEVVEDAGQKAAREALSGPSGPFKAMRKGGRESAEQAADTAAKKAARESSQELADEALEKGAKESADAFKQADNVAKNAADASKQADQAAKRADDAAKEAAEASKRQADEAKRFKETVEGDSELAEAARKRADNAADSAAARADDARKAADEAAEKAGKAREAADQAQEAATAARKRAGEAQVDLARGRQEAASKILDDSAKEWGQRNVLYKVLPADGGDFAGTIIGNMLARGGGEGIEHGLLGGDAPGDKIVDAVSGNERGEHPGVTLESADVQEFAGDLVTDKSPVKVKVTFSKKISGFHTGHVRTQPAGIVNSMTMVTAGEEYELLVTPNVTPGSYFTVDVDSAQVYHEDEWQLRYPNKAAQQLRVRFDNLDPTVVLSSPQAGATRISPIPATATFNVDVTGFVQNDVVATNATVGGFTKISDREYTFQVTPQSEGPVRVEVPAGAAQSASQRDSQAAVPLDFTYDVTPPVVTLTSRIIGTTGRSNPLVRLEADKPLAGFRSSVVQLTNAVLKGTTVIEPDRVWQLRLDAQAPGPVTATVPVGAVFDPAGNANDTAASVSVVYDPAYATSSTVTSMSLAPTVQQKVQTGLSIMGL